MMRRITLANTDCTVSRLGFGTASLHHFYRQSERLGILEKAYDAGFTHFDTAPMYGEGQAERTIGKFLARNKVRERVTLATKIGLPSRPVLRALPLAMYANKAFRSTMVRTGISISDQRERNLSQDGCERSLSQSLAAMNTDYLDLLMLHEPEFSDVSQIEELAEWLNRQKVSGRVRYLGLAGRASSCLSVTRRISGVFDILQVNDSIEKNEAGALCGFGWPLQITYGYLRGSTDPSHDVECSSPLNRLRAGLFKNKNGMVLVSTRKKNRIERMSELVNEIDD